MIGDRVFMVFTHFLLMSVFSKLAHFCEFCVYLSVPLRRAQIHSAYFKDCGSQLDLDTLPPARGWAQAPTGKRGEMHSPMAVRNHVCWLFLPAR